MAKVTKSSIVHEALGKGVTRNADIADYARKHYGVELGRHVAVFKSKAKRYQKEMAADDVATIQKINTLVRDLPPGGGGFVVPDVQQHVGLYNTNRFYLNPDEAYRANRIDARTMLRSLDVREPLQARMLATALLPGSVEPPNKKDRFQVDIASKLQAIIDDTPHFLKYKLALLWAIWFGKAGVQNNYQWDYSRGYKRLVVKDWSPVHGDSIVYKWTDAKVGVLVGNVGGTHGLRPLTSEATYYGRAHVLDNETREHELSLHEREAFVIHAHELVAGDFFEPEAAGSVKGLGLRSTVYYTWYLIHEILGWLINFCEKSALGLWVYYFEQGNVESYNKVRELAESQAQNNVVLWPREPGQVNSAAGVERIEPTATGIDNLLKVIQDYLGKQLKRYIVGQDLTSEAHSTGLGSAVAEAHENTFGRIVRFDSINLAETLTSDLVQVVQRWTFPGLPFQCRYVIAADKPDPEKYMGGVRDFVDIGGTVDEDEVRAVLGLTRPDKDATVLGGRPAAPPAATLESTLAEKLGTPATERYKGAAALPGGANTSVPSLEDEKEPHR